MLLSKLLLNPRSRQVQAELWNPYEMHRTIMSGYSDGIAARDRVLYRLESRTQPPYLTLLVQSHTTPDWQNLWQKGYLIQPADTRPFEPGFSAGQLLNFRLVANPTRKVKDEKNENGKRVGLYESDEQEKWLLRKAEQNGFAVRALQMKPPDMLTGSLIRDGQRHALKIVMVQFDGILEVMDAIKMKEAVVGGIGSAKGLGCGLLSLAKVG